MGTLGLLSPEDRALRIAKYNKQVGEEIKKQKGKDFKMILLRISH